MDINNLTKFRFWCQKVLPLVYDDSLSYYEVLCKITDYINKLIENDDMFADAIKEIQYELAQIQINYGIYETFSKVIRDSEYLHDGDIVTTRGFYNIGEGGGSYIIHDNNADYYIKCGDKYAELIVDNVINIDSLGAKGYEVDSTFTDNNQLVNIALALANRLNPKTVLIADVSRGNIVIEFGRHQYNFVDKIYDIRNNSSITFRGIDENSTILTFSSTEKYLLTVKEHTDGYTNNAYFFENITFYGDGYMLNFEEINHSKFTNCRFINNQRGVTLEKACGVDFDKCYFFNNAEYGCTIEDNSTTVHFNECTFRASTYGLLMSSDTCCNGICIDNSIIEYNDIGMSIRNTTDFSISNSWVEGNNVELIDSECYVYNVHTSVGMSSEEAKVKFIKSQNESYIKTNCVGVNDVQMSTYALSSNKGVVKLTNGDTYNFDERTVYIKSTKSFDLSILANAIEGIVEIHSSEGSYIGVLSYEYNDHITLTKVAGSFDSPTASNDTIDISSLVTGNDFSWLIKC